MLPRKKCKRNLESKGIIFAGEENIYLFVYVIHLLPQSSQTLES